jgi:polyphosphate glucokinase
MKMRVLVLDVGGTNVKVLMSGQRTPLKIPSGQGLTPRRMVADVRRATKGWKYDAVSIGFPSAVVRGRILSEPANLGRGWVRFNFEKAFRKPVKIINDAAMQALGSYEGGTMLFLGLGTGLGSAIVIDGVLGPMELAHLPYRNGQYEDYVGLRGFKKYGKRRWRKHVKTVVALLKAALVADYVVLGGGQTKLLKRLPQGCRLGNNANAFVGGLRIWELYKGKPARPRRRTRGGTAPLPTTDGDAQAEVAPEDLEPVPSDAP